MQDKIQLELKCYVEETSTYSWYNIMTSYDPCSQPHLKGKNFGCWGNYRIYIFLWKLWNNSHVVLYPYLIGVCIIPSSLLAHVSHRILTMYSELLVSWIRCSKKERLPYRKHYRAAQKIWIAELLCSFRSFLHILNVVKFFREKFILWNKSENMTVSMHKFICILTAYS